MGDDLPKDLDEMTIVGARVKRLGERGMFIHPPGSNFGSPASAVGS